MDPNINVNKDLKDKVEDFLNLKLENLNKEASLIQLGLDSIKLIELSGIIEEELTIEIDPEIALTWKIKDILKFINK